MWLRTLIVWTLMAACGGGAESGPKRLSTGTPAPRSSGKGGLRERLEEILGRLEACRPDFAARVPPGDACKQALRELADGCGTVDLEELAAHDRITERCKESLWKLLPGQDSHRDRLFVLGAMRTPADLQLYVTASDANGEPTRADTRVYLEIAGRLELVTGAEAAPLPARCNAPLFTASSILDYSGSMSDRDVDESIEVMRAIYDAVPDGCLESDVVLFSDTVRRKYAASADRAALKRAVARDEQFARGMTALVDAVAEGVSGTRTRRAPIRVALVATDGMENASSRWSYPQLVRAAQDANVRVISFGSLLSDVDFLEQLGNDTGGFFIYRPRARVLAEAARTVGRLLAATQTIGIVDARLATATHVVVELGTQRVRIAL